MIKNFFKTAVRNLLRHRIYSFINIMGLGLGLSCAMLIILYVKDEVSYDRFHKGVSQIYRVTTERTNPDGTDAGSGGITGFFQGPRFTAGIPEIKTFVRLQSRYMDVKSGQEVKGKELHMADSNFFNFFSFPLLSGNPTTALLNPQSIVISEETAINQFGTRAALGKTLMIKTDGNEFSPFLVTGVAKNCPENSSIKFHMLIPLRVSGDDETRDENWFNYFLNTFITLHPGTDPKRVESKMKAVFEADARDAMKVLAEKYNDNAVTRHGLQRFTDMHLSERFPASNGLTSESKPVYSYILSGIALFILLIACINFVNLTIARSLKRAREIGVRKVMGGHRRQLVMQFLGESFFVCLLAFSLSIAFVQWLLPLFNQLSNKSLAISYLFDAKLIVGYLLLLLATGFLAGFYPALVLSGFRPVDVLYRRYSVPGKNYLQKGLVTLQFSLASFLIIMTIVIYSQFNHLVNQDLGYDDANLVAVDLGGQGIGHSYAESVKAELSKSPSIAGVTCKNGGFWGTVAKVNGETQISFAYETVDETYIPLLGIPVIKGRNFSRDFPSDSVRSVIVNEAFVRKAGWRDPIGKEVNFWYNEGEKYTVIGVVKDYHYETLAKGISPQLFTMKPGNRFGLALIKIKPGTATVSLAYIGNVFKRLFPTTPYSYRFRDEENRSHYRAEEKWKQIMLFAALLTIFISSIGLFGLSVLSAEKRTKEIGVRKVLGASVTGITTILSKDFLKLVAVALAVAIPAAWLAGNSWLESYPYRVSLSWWMFFLAAFLVIGLALVTVSFQAIKAAIANPVKSLRTE